MIFRPPTWMLRAPRDLIEISGQVASLLLRLHGFPERTSRRGGTRSTQEVAKHFAEKLVSFRDEVKTCSAKMDEWEERFGAVSHGLAKYQGRMATSIHRLVVDMAEAHVIGLLATAGMIDGVEEDDIDEAARLQSVYMSFGVEEVVSVVSSLDNSRLREAVAFPSLGKKAVLRFFLKLWQEVFRVWRDFYGQGEYAIAVDDARLRPMLFAIYGIPIPTEGRRPCYERDHHWLDWQLSGLKPAQIRDKWNGMTDHERMRICPNCPAQVGVDGTDFRDKKAGRATVKEGLKKAKNEREKARVEGGSHEVSPVFPPDPQLG